MENFKVTNIRFTMTSTAAADFLAERDCVLIDGEWIRWFEMEGKIDAFKAEISNRLGTIVTVGTVGAARQFTAFVLDDGVVSLRGDFHRAPSLEFALEILPLAKEVLEVEYTLDEKRGRVSGKQVSYLYSLLKSARKAAQLAHSSEFYFRCFLGQYLEEVVTEEIPVDEELMRAFTIEEVEA